MAAIFLAVVIICACTTLASLIDLEDNTYAVYEAYQSRSTFDGSTFYSQASSCESHTGLKWNALTWCVEALTVNTMKKSATNKDDHWQRPKGANQTSCSYALQNFTTPHDIKGKRVFSFQIVQSNCTSSWPLAKGGSSFDVVAAGNTLRNCAVVDLFDDTYRVNCPLGRNGVPHSCENISVTLNFEHYDAFAERGAYYERQYNPLGVSIAQSLRHCLPAGPTSSEVPPNPRDIIDSKARLLRAPGEGVWRLKSSLTSKSTPEIAPAAGSAASLGNATLVSDSINNTYEVNSQFKWIWHHRMPPVNLRRCLEQQRVIMIGASHCRYNWDDMAITAFPELAKPVFKKTIRHHMNLKFGDFEFMFAFFAKEVGPMLKGICDEALVKKSNYTVVFQIGSWDSTFWPAQQFISNPLSASSVIKELNNVLDRGCGEYISFVWVQQVPYPNCLVGRPDGTGMSEKCADERRARNNHKISLMNIFFERELRQLYANRSSSALSSPSSASASSSFRLQIVPAFEIISPRLPYSEYVCNNHYLCRLDNADQMQRTPAGDAVVESVKRAVCKDFL
jgi:hypothetical protein